MNPDHLEQLLRQADADAGLPPRMPVDLAARVRRRAGARQRRTTLLTSAAAAILLAIGFFGYPRGRQPGSYVKQSESTTHQVAPRPATDYRIELARLDRQIESRLAIARRLDQLTEARQCLAALRTQKVDLPDPVAEARAEMDQAAFTLVQQADRLYRELHLPAPAADSYRRAIRLFPDTPWADVARTRLVETEPETGALL